jgi:hypothetical protein
MLTAVANPDGIAKEMQGTYVKVMGRAARARGRAPAPAMATDSGADGGDAERDRSEASASIERPVPH